MERSRIRLERRHGAPSKLPPVALAVATLLSAGASAEPILYPPTPHGPAVWRDERDVAPWLAAWKAEAFRRTLGLRAAATVNQQAYDVTWYDLDLAFTPVGSQVSGTVRTQATVVAGPLATLDLDLLSNMSVDAVSSAGIPTTFTRTADVLTVNLDRAYATGEQVDVRVTYHGSPVAGSFGFTIANGRQLIWSLSEPYGARSWWPCKDQPSDKADSVTIRYTVPSGLVTASNGTRLSATDDGLHAVTRWRESYPISSYLVSIASYPYTQTLDWYRPSPTDSMRIDFFNFPETAAGVASIQARVKDMLGVYASHFGPYPFLAEKYGHAQFVFGGGMEHQTCTSLGSFAEFVVAHELGHQWWGDLVTCRDFHHIWLNEGFATYCEALWAESKGGPTAYHADLSFNKYLGAGTIWVPDDQNASRIFDSNLSYDKASWVLNMLRHIMGDAAFFLGMLQYRAAHAYGTAVTEDFEAACEAASGRDLSKFFQQWIYGEFYPVYRSSWTAAPAGGGYDVQLAIEQRQAWQLFTLPVDVRVLTDAGPRDFVVQDSLAAQAATLHVDAAPTAVVLDADDWILKQVERTVVQPPFDRAVLVVNGVDWGTYGSEITTAYTDHAFAGDYPVDFWDHFPSPPTGYPSALPAPLGHGPVPPEILGHYRNVVWVGDDTNGDLDSWKQTPVLSYLRAGGNLLLMTRMGDAFLDDSLRTYLGITLRASNATFDDCVATRAGLVNLSRTGAQTLCALYDTVRTVPESQLLYESTNGLTTARGLGFVRLPAGGAGLRSNGGRFAFLSGRPYRWTHAPLHAATGTILSQVFGEPLNGVGVRPGTSAPALVVSAARPNPAAGRASVRIELAARARVSMDVVDVSGRTLWTIDAGWLAAGAHELAWDGVSAGGSRMPAGIYWLRVRAGQARAIRRIVRLE